MLFPWASVAPLLNASVSGLLLIRRGLKLASEGSGVSYVVASRSRRFVTVGLWSLVAWGMPIVAVWLLFAGNRFEVGHHPLPEGLERVWVNAGIWSIPGGVVLLASSLVVIVYYLDRLLRCGVKNGVIYAFSAWVFMRIGWLQCFTWLRSSQLGDEWREVFVTGAFTVEFSVVVAAVALIVAMILGFFSSSSWLPGLVLCFTLPAVVQYWMAGETIALLDGVFSLGLFGYAVSKIMVHRSMIGQGGVKGVNRLNRSSSRPARRLRLIRLRLIVPIVLCALVIGFLGLLSVGIVRPVSIVMNAVPLGLFAYAVYRIVIYRSMAGQSDAGEVNRWSYRPDYFSGQIGSKFIVVCVLCTVGVALITVVIGVKPGSIGSSVVPLAIALCVFVATILAMRRVRHQRFKDSEVATTATICSLVVASLVVHWSWIVSVFGDYGLFRDYGLDVWLAVLDVWLIYGLQVILMAVVGCVGLVVALYRDHLRDFRPFFAGLTIQLLGYLILLGILLGGSLADASSVDFSSVETVSSNADVMSWKTGNVLPLFAYEWIAMSVVLGFILGAIWFVFGVGSSSSDGRVGSDGGSLPLGDVRAGYD